MAKTARKWIELDSPFTNILALSAGHILHSDWRNIVSNPTEPWSRQSDLTGEILNFAMTEIGEQWSPSPAAINLTTTLNEVFDNIYALEYCVGHVSDTITNGNFVKQKAGSVSQAGYIPEWSANLEIQQNTVLPLIANRETLPMGSGHGTLPSEYVVRNFVGSATAGVGDVVMDSPASMVAGNFIIADETSPDPGVPPFNVIDSGYPINNGIFWNAATPAAGNIPKFGGFTGPNDKLVDSGYSINNLLIYPTLYMITATLSFPAAVPNAADGHVILRRSIGDGVYQFSLEYRNGATGYNASATNAQKYKISGPGESSPSWDTLFSTSTETRILSLNLNDLQCKETYYGSINYYTGALFDATLIPNPPTTDRSLVYVIDSSGSGKNGIVVSISGITTSRDYNISFIISKAS